MFTPLLPFILPGFVVEHVSTADALLLVDARASTPAASCPDCHTASAHVHSRYTRHLRDLPVAEHPVRLRLQVRRFRCATPTCPCQTFAERLPAYDLDAPLPAALQARATQGLRSQFAKFYVPGWTPTLREIATRKVSLDALPFIGTPQRVADSMARTMEAIGGDGFAIRQGLWPGYVDPFVEQVVPLLQQRGVVRTAYTGRTLWEHLQEF